MAYFRNRPPDVFWLTERLGGQNRKTVRYEAVKELLTAGRTLYSYDA